MMQKLIEKKNEQYYQPFNVEDRYGFNQFYNDNKSIKEKNKKQEIKIEPFMMDPSLMFTKSHLNFLNRYGKENELYISNTMYEIFKALLNDNHKEHQECLYGLVDLFAPYNSKTNLFNKRYLQTQELRKRLFYTAKPYSYKIENCEELIKNINLTRLPPYINNIILDQYSFFKEHSGLLSRTRKTYSILKKVGVKVLDYADEKFEYKEEYFRKHKGFKSLRMFIGISLIMTNLLPEGHPAIKALTTSSGVILLVFDP